MTEYHLDLEGAFNWLGTYSDTSKRYYGDDGPKIREDRILKVSRNQRLNLPWLDLEEAQAEATCVVGFDSAQDKSGFLGVNVPGGEESRVLGEFQ